MSEYPEHIDHIDDFYRSQLADHEIEPPEGLWDKISLGAFEAKSPAEANAAVNASSGSASLLSATQKLIGVGGAAALLVAGALYFYTNKQNLHPVENNTQPSIEQPVEELNHDTVNNNSSESSTVQESISPSSDKKSSATTNSQSVESVNAPNAIETPVNETPEEVPAIINTPPQEQRADSIADIKTTQKAPKEKVKFKDKYKKEYQDSTRKIFVPGK